MPQGKAFVQVAWKEPLDGSVYGSVCLSCCNSIRCAAGYVSQQRSPGLETFSEFEREANLFPLAPECREVPEHRAASAADYQADCRSVPTAAVNQDVQVLVLTHKRISSVQQRCWFYLQTVQWTRGILELAVQDVHAGLTGQWVGCHGGAYLSGAAVHGCPALPAERRLWPFWKMTCRSGSTGCSLCSVHT